MKSKRCCRKCVDHEDGCIVRLPLIIDSSMHDRAMPRPFNASAGRIVRKICMLYEYVCLKYVNTFKKAKRLNTFERLQARWIYLYIGLDAAIARENSYIYICLVRASSRLAYLHEHKNKSRKNIKQRPTV